VLNAHIITPPANDDFVSAKPVSSIPFSDTPDLSGATLQAGEPNPSCGFNPTPQSSVWYAFNPAQTASYTVNTSSGSFFPQVAAYSGASLTTLTQVGCGTPTTFHAIAGATYYIQLTNQVGTGGPISVFLDQAPPLQMSFFFSPSEPSTFDTVQFFDQSFDPAFVGINSTSWNLGDGTAVAGCCPSHRYETDGDYTVKLTDATADGRVGSTTQVLHVRTHDVSIAKFTVPQTASASQTRSITVGVSDTRYPETVEVQLFRNDTLVGTLTQQVPVRTGGRTTTFSFNYTFTSDDAALGKITFKAVATIVNARDAFPSDNTAIALPTKVTR
jgi:PKD repeat protein